MFILPAESHSFNAVASPTPDWHLLLAPLRLPLTFGVTLFVLLVLGTVFLSSRMPGVSVPLGQKAQQTTALSLWFGVKFSCETLPSVSMLEALPESQRPISMAKIIMNRHEHRAHTPRRTLSAASASYMRPLLSP
ncbi:hypothetical protein K438DRAFT_1764087 [Mycena galopus ATCC 62051]|nr:hypothetical protein K438DRAFT_1764087 [Mycena galopus ATCC 62051]